MADRRLPSSESDHHSADQHTVIDFRRQEVGRLSIRSPQSDIRLTTYPPSVPWVLNVSVLSFKSCEF